MTTDPSANDPDDVFDAAVNIAGSDQPDDPDRPDDPSVLDDDSVTIEPDDVHDPDPDLVPYHPPLPTPGEPITTFMASFRSMTIIKNGDMEVRFIVPQAQKYAALPLTDYPGMLMKFQVERYRRVYATLAGPKGTGGNGQGSNGSGEKEL